MSIIKRKADWYVKTYITGHTPELENVSKAKEYLYDVSRIDDKVIFLTTIIEGNETQKSDHVKTCKEQLCIDIFDEITFLLTQQLHGIGVDISKNDFTSEDANIANDKIDSIVAELERLKAENKNLKESYDELIAELKELKDYKYLGKSKWYSIVYGKLIEGVAGKMIDKVNFSKLLKIAHDGYESLSDTFNNLIA